MSYESETELIPFYLVLTSLLLFGHSLLAVIDSTRIESNRIESNLQTGLKYLKQALGFDPGNAQIMTFIGIAHLQMGRLNEALSQFESAYQIAPQELETAYGLAKCLYARWLDAADEAEQQQQQSSAAAAAGSKPPAVGAQDSDLDRAVSVLTAALNPHEAYGQSGLAAAYSLLLKILEKLERRSEATSRARDWVARAPNEALAHFSLGRLLLARDAYSEAVRAFSTAQRIDKSKPEIFYSLAQAQWRLGHLEEAKAAVNTAIQIKTAEDSLLKTIRQSEEAKRREEDMMRPPGSPSSRPPPAPTKHERSHFDRCYFLQGKILAEMAVTGSTGSGSGSDSGAAAEVKTFEEAESAFSKYIQLRPDEPEGHYQRALSTCSSLHSRKIFCCFVCCSDTQRVCVCVCVLCSVGTSEPTGRGIHCVYGSDSGVGENMQSISRIRRFVQEIFRRSQTRCGCFGQNISALYWCERHRYGEYASRSERAVRSGSAITGLAVNTKHSAAAVCFVSSDYVNAFCAIVTLCIYFVGGMNRAISFLSSHSMEK